MVRSRGVVMDAIALTKADAGELLTLQRAAYATEAQAHGDPHLPPLVESLADVRRALADPTTTSLGNRDDGRLVAAVRTIMAPDGLSLELGRLAVAPDRQGEGLGSRLLAVVEGSAPASVAEIRLFTGEHSPANLRLYGRCGYEETGREPTSAGYSVVHLVKRLT